MKWVGRQHFRSARSRALLSQTNQADQMTKRLEDGADNRWLFCLGRRVFDLRRLWRHIDRGPERDADVVAVALGSVCPPGLGSSGPISTWLSA